MTYDVENLIQARLRYLQAQTEWFNAQQNQPFIRAQAEQNVILEETARIVQENPNADPAKALGANEKERERNLLVLLESYEPWRSFLEEVCNLHTSYQDAKTALEIELDRRRAAEMAYQDDPLRGLVPLA